MHEKMKLFEGTTKTLQKFINSNENKKRDAKLDDDRQRVKLLSLQATQLDKLDDIKREVENRLSRQNQWW